MYALISLSVVLPFLTCSIRGGARHSISIVGCEQYYRRVGGGGGGGGLNPLNALLMSCSHNIITSKNNVWNSQIRILLHYDWSIATTVRNALSVN